MKKVAIFFFIFCIGCTEQPQLKESEFAQRLESTIACKDYKTFAELCCEIIYEKSFSSDSIRATLVKGLQVQGEIPIAALRIPTPAANVARIPQAIRDLLRHAHPGGKVPVKCFAAFALGSQPGNAMDNLISLLDDPRPFVLLSAWSSMFSGSNSEPNESPEQLKAMLVDVAPVQRARALLICTQPRYSFMGKRQGSSRNQSFDINEKAKLIYSALQDRDWLVRAAAISCLCENGSVWALSDDSKIALINALRDVDPIVRNTAYGYRFRKQLEPEIDVPFESEEFGLRIYKDLRSAIPLLKDGLRNSSPHTRLFTLRIVAKLTNAVELLRVEIGHIAEADNDAEIKSLAAQVLK